MTSGRRGMALVSRNQIVPPLIPYGNVLLRVIILYCIHCNYCNARRAIVSSLLETPFFAKTDGSRVNNERPELIARDQRLSRTNRHWR